MSTFNRPGRQRVRDPFDIWLDQGLRTLYEPVLQEAIPEHLLELIDGDRARRAVPQPQCPTGKGFATHGD